MAVRPILETVAPNPLGMNFSDIVSTKKLFKSSLRQRNKEFQVFFVPVKISYISKIAENIDGFWHLKATRSVKSKTMFDFSNVEK
jgi:hypothetical protein